MRPDVLADHLATTIRGLLDPLALRVASLEMAGGASAAVCDQRLRALEARAPIPGPAGPPGPPGLDGKDGAPGVRYLGVHAIGKTYDVGDLVTAGGSAWYCRRTTTGTPRQSPDWQLMVKGGRDLRDARGDR